MINVSYNMLSLVMLLILFIISPACDEPDHPSDLSLIKIFEQNETDFETLAKMSIQDLKVVRIAHDFTWLENNVAWPRPDSQLGFSKERWDQYRSIFRKLGLKEGIHRREDEPEVTFFIASSRGLVTGGSDKGYVYSIKEIGPLVESLDQRKFPLRDMEPVYRKIKDNWYLYYMAGG